MEEKNKNYFNKNIHNHKKDFKKNNFNLKSKNKDFVNTNNLKDSVNNLNTESKIKNKPKIRSAEYYSTSDQRYEAYLKKIYRTNDLSTLPFKPENPLTAKKVKVNISNNLKKPSSKFIKKVKKSLIKIPTEYVSDTGSFSLKPGNLLDFLVKKRDKRKFRYRFRRKVLGKWRYYYFPKLDKRLWVLYKFRHFYRLYTLPWVYESVRLFFKSFFGNTRRFLRSDVFKFFKQNHFLFRKRFKHYYFQYKLYYPYVRLRRNFVDRYYNSQVFKSLLSTSSRLLFKRFILNYKRSLKFICFNNLSINSGVLLYVKRKLGLISYRNLKLALKVKSYKFLLKRTLRRFSYLLRKRKIKQLKSKRYHLYLKNFRFSFKKRFYKKLKVFNYKKKKLFYRNLKKHKFESYNLSNYTEFKHWFLVNNFFINKYYLKVNSDVILRFLINDRLFNGSYYYNDVLFTKLKFYDFNTISNYSKFASLYKKQRKLLSLIKRRRKNKYLFKSYNKSLYFIRKYMLYDDIVNFYFKDFYFKDFYKSISHPSKFGKLIMVIRYNNIFVSLLNSNNKLVYMLTGGSLKFYGSKRRANYCREKVIFKVAEIANSLNFKVVDIYLKFFSKRFNFALKKSLVSSQLNIRFVFVNPRVSHGYVRPKKLRRK